MVVPILKNTPTYPIPPCSISEGGEGGGGGGCYEPPMLPP